MTINDSTLTASEILALALGKVASPRCTGKGVGGFDLLLCDGCDIEINIGFEGITTDDGLELCMGCQSGRQGEYDSNWKRLQSPKPI